MTKVDVLKLRATLSEEDLRRICEWSARRSESAKEQGRREGIEEVALWLEGKMPKWGAASKVMAAEVRALQRPRASFSNNHVAGD